LYRDRVYCKLDWSRWSETPEVDVSDEPPTEDGGIEHPRSAAGVPRWVKVSGVIAALLVLLVVVLLFAGHDPGRHAEGLAVLAGQPR
jgi:hypothetical protein